VRGEDFERFFADSEAGPINRARRDVPESAGLCRDEEEPLPSPPGRYQPLLCLVVPSVWRSGRKTCAEPQCALSRESGERSAPCASPHAQAPGPTPRRPSHDDLDVAAQRGGPRKQTFRGEAGKPPVQQGALLALKRPTCALPPAARREASFAGRGRRKRGSETWGLTNTQRCAIFTQRVAWPTYAD